MSRELQVLCFLVGANSIFFGEKLLTAPNPEASEDAELFRALGLPVLPQEKPGRLSTCSNL
jgi:biotin synthase